MKGLHLWCILPCVLNLQLNSPCRSCALLVFFNVRLCGERKLSRTAFYLYQSHMLSNVFSQCLQVLGSQRFPRKLQTWKLSNIVKFGFITNRRNLTWSCADVQLFNCTSWRCWVTCFPSVYRTDLLYWIPHSRCTMQRVKPTFKNHLKDFILHDGNNTQWLPMCWLYKLSSQRGLLWNKKIIIESALT